MRFLTVLFLLFANACAHAQLDDPEHIWPATLVERAAESDVARLVSAHLEFLASDAMGGRDTASPEGDITALYVAAQFRRLGLEPAGTDGYLQHYPLVRSKLMTDSCRLALAGDEGSGYVLGGEYLVRDASAAGVDLELPVAWAGWGLLDEEAGLDDFAALDLEGRLVLMFYGAPEGRSDLAAAGAWRTKKSNALARGAAGVAFLVPEGDKYGERIYGWVRRGQGRQSLTLGALEEDGKSVPRIFVRERVGRDLFTAAGLDWDAARDASRASPGSGGVLLDGPRLSLTARLEVEELQAANVAGLLRGSDPELAREVIVLSAHMDHVGRDDDGGVFNGADDNASGTTAVMSVADLLSRDPEGLERSVLFLTVSGEEKGLLGSEWFVEHPTLPIEQIVGNINIDMVGRNDSFAIGATPSPAHPAYNTLASRAREAGAQVGLEVEWEAGEGKYRKRVDEYYARSDHMHFSNADIPVVFFFSGEHEDYHKQTDTLEKIDQAKVRRVVRMVEGLVRDIADDELPPAAIDAGEG